MSISKARSARMRKKTSFEKFSELVNNLSKNPNGITLERLQNAKEELQRLYEDFKVHHAALEELLSEKEGDNAEGPSTEMKTLATAFETAQAKFWEQDGLFFDAIQTKLNEKVMNEACEGEAKDGEAKQSKVKQSKAKQSKAKQSKPKPKQA